MPIQTIQQTLSGGEVSPRLGGRVDFSRYFASLALCENYQTLPQGGIRRRDGTQFIAPTKFPNRKSRLIPFEFSIEQAYILEFGHEYIRIFLDLGRLETAPDTPIEVTTPYQEEELFDIQVAQSADVLFIVHPNHPPANFIRLAEFEWDYEAITFQPPATVERPITPTTSLTLSATTGTSVTATAGTAFFLDGDVGRQIQTTNGVAAITELIGNSPTNQATVSILDDFDSTNIIAGDWQLHGSPALSIRSNITGPVGSIATLDLEMPEIDAPELIQNGDFTNGATFWANLSSPLVESGNVTANNAGRNLIDSAKDFVALGVEIGHEFFNISDGSSSTFPNGINQFLTTVNPNDTCRVPAPGLVGGVGNNWQIGDAYEIRQTGTFDASNNRGELDPGFNGIGHCEQAVTVLDTRRYRLTFDVDDQPVAVRIGSTSGADDIFPITTFNVGDAQTLSFIANGTTAFVGFSNDQIGVAAVDNVSVKASSSDGFRPEDVGKYVFVNEGTIEITEFVDASRVRGVVLGQLTSTAVSGAGNWFLLVAAWSDTEGYPRTLSFHDGRLFFGGTRQQPLGIWGSVAGDFFSFAGGTTAERAITISISANQQNTIEWLEPLRDLVVGTRGGEHLITGGNNPLTPSNVSQVPQSDFGSPPFRPLRLDDVLYLLQRGRRQIQEATIDQFTNLLRSREITLLSEQITQSGLTQWAFQAQPTKTIWAVRRDGTLVGFTTDLIEEVRGWHRHTTDGTFESVMTSPVDAGTNGETERVWVIVRRIVDGLEQRFVEVMRPSLIIDDIERAQLCLDSALMYDGTPATTLSGLDHLEGREVEVVKRELIDGVERLSRLGPHEVSGGQITLNVSVTRADVGLTYLPRIRTLRPELSFQDGTLQERLTRWVRYYVRLIDSQGLRIDGKDVPFRLPSDLMDVGLPVGNHDVVANLQGWEIDSSVTIEQPLPFPSTILLLSGAIEFEEVG